MYWGGAGAGKGASLRLLVLGRLGRDADCGFCVQSALHSPRHARPAAPGRALAGALHATRVRCMQAREKCIRVQAGERCIRTVVRTCKHGPPAQRGSPMCIRCIRWPRSPPFRPRCRPCRAAPPPPPAAAFFLASSRASSVLAELPNTVTFCNGHFLNLAPVTFGARAREATGKRWGE